MAQKVGGPGPPPGHKGAAGHDKRERENICVLLVKERACVRERPPIKQPGLIFKMAAGCR